MNLLGIASPEDEAEAMRRKLLEAGVTAEDFVAAKKKPAASLLDPVSTPSAPDAPFERARKNYGTGEAILRRVANLFTGGLLDEAIIPEMAASGRAQHKSDLELWKKQRELELEGNYVDPHDKALADAIRGGAVGPELMALQVLASGADPLNMDQTTLSPGQIRYDAFGNVVARGGDPVVNPTAAIQDAQAIARTRGIPTDSPYFGDLVSAITEPTETRVDANGNTYSVNTVSEVLRRWDEEQSRQTSPQVQPSEGVSPTTTATNPQDFNTLGPVLSGLNEKQAQLVTDAPEKLKFYERFGTNLSQLGRWDEKAQRFILNEDVTDLYGSWDGNPLNPQNWNGFGDDGDNGGFGGDTELFMPQGNRDAKAVIEQLIESLAVDERGQLKGQGQITEGETAMLRAAVTRAAKRGMGDKAAEDEFTRLYLEYQKALAEQQGLVDRYWPKKEAEQEIIDLDAN